MVDPKTQTPLILVSNDDGISSPGLHAVVEALQSIGRIVVVAPARQQSSTGRSLRADPDERLQRVDFSWAGPNVEAYACDASPAMTVLHGLDVLFHDRLPDVMVSGINYGENLGSNMMISGTVGAAIEAATDGVPALAMSLQTDHGMHHAHGEVDWVTAMHFTAYFARRMLATPLPHDVDVLNVVLPADATPDTPWRLTTQSRQGYFSTRFPTPHPDNTIGSAEFGVFVDEATLEPDSDIRAVLVDRVVSVTPLSLDMTSRIAIAPFEAILRG